MIYFYLSELVTGLRHSRFASFITMFTLFVSILITSAILFLFFYSQKIERKIKEQVVIRVFIDDAVTGSKVNDLRNTIRKNEFVKRVEYISKDRAAEIFTNKTGENFLEVLDENPLPATFNIRLNGEKITKTNIERVVKSLTNLDGITDYDYDYSLSMKLIEMLKSGNYIFYGVSLVFLLFSIYMVYTTNRLVIENKIVEYNNMKLVGATITSIKIPLYLQGILLGLLAAVLASGVIYFGFSFVGKLHLLKRISFMGVRNVIFPFFFCVGALYGLAGGYFATRRITLNVNLNK